jgi:hypothetical protein
MLQRSMVVPRERFISEAALVGALRPASEHNYCAGTADPMWFSRPPALRRFSAVQGLTN